MNFLVILMIFFSNGWNKYNEPEKSGELVLKFDNLRNNKGQILLSVFKSADGFPDNADKALMSKVVDIPPTGKVSVSLGKLKYGRYSVAILHDEDGNKQMTYSRLGFPKEGYGFTNNPGRLFRKPDFNSTALTLSEKEKVVLINMVY
jgi:uncharacterized protein (DUF2141 family)